MPGSRAGHLRSMIRNDHTVEVVALENGQNADHVHIAFVDEGLSIVGDLPGHIPKMQVADLSLPAVAIDSVVNIPLRYFSNGSLVEFLLCNIPGRNDIHVYSLGCLLLIHAPCRGFAMC